MANEQDKHEQEALAFRAFQLGEVEPTAENALKVGLPHPDTHNGDQSQVSEPVKEETPVVVKRQPFAQPFKRDIIGGEDH